MRLYIDSRYRTPDSASSSDFTVELNEALDLPSRTRVRVFNLCVPYSWYTVETGVNEYLYIRERRIDNSFQVRVIALPIGMYNGPKLATNLAAALNTGSMYTSAGNATPYAVTYNDRTGRVTVVLSGPGGWAFVDDQSLATATDLGISFQGGASRQRPKSFNRNLRISTLTEYGTAVPYTSEFVDLMAVKAVYLTSNSLGNLSNVGPAPGQRDVLCVLPVTVSYGYLICDQDSSMDSEYTDCSGQLLKRLSFRLADASGSVIDLHGLDISFALSFDAR